MRIPHAVVALSEMDLAGHRTDAFSRLKNEFETLLKPLGFAKISVIAVSAITGDNGRYGGSSR